MWRRAFIETRSPCVEHFAKWLQSSQLVGQSRANRSKPLARPWKGVRLQAARTGLREVRGDDPPRPRRARPVAGANRSVSQRFALSRRSCARKAMRQSRLRSFFYDTSKNHTRRWCSTTGCGNRMRVPPDQFSSSPASTMTMKPITEMASPRASRNWTISQRLVDNI